MFTSLVPLYPLILPFLLVLFRLLGMIAFVPFFSTSTIPGNVKVLLGLAIAFCVWNAVPNVRTMALHGPETLPGLVVAVAGEMSVGLVIGMMIGGMFAGLQLGAHLISQQMGLSLATLYDPSFEDQSTVIEQVAFWLALVVFLSIGGHRAVLNAVVESFQSVPIGKGGFAPDVMLDIVLGSIQAGFQAAARIAMPALVAFFVATLTSGLMSRSMPQLNLMSIGITLNLIVGLLMVMVGLGGWALVAHDSMAQTFEAIAKLITPSPT